MVKVMAVFRHRPDKVERILPYAKLDYRVIKPQINRTTYSSSLINVALLPASIVWTLVAPSKFHKQIREYDPDIIFTHGGKTAYREAMLAKKLGKKLVMRLGGHIYDEMWDNLSVKGLSANIRTKPMNMIHYRFAFKNLKMADHVITVTQEMKEKLCQESGRDPNTVSVVPVPIDLEKFTTPKLVERTVLCVINLNFQSKLKAMVDYLPALEESNALVFAPGRYRQPLQERTSLMILRYIPMIEKEYQRARALCYFSYLDGCPNVILEAWASKTPVIANRCRWSEELIQDGVTGFLVNKPDDVGNVLDMLTRMPRIKNKVIQNGFEYVTTHHSEKTAGKILGNVMRKICES